MARVARVPPANQARDPAGSPARALHLVETMAMTDMTAQANLAKVPVASPVRVHLESQARAPVMAMDMIVSHPESQARALVMAMDMAVGHPGSQARVHLANQARAPLRVEIMVMMDTPEEIFERVSKLHLCQFV